MRSAQIISNVSTIVSVLVSERGDVLCVIYVPSTSKKMQMFLPRQHLRLMVRKLRKEQLLLKSRIHDLCKTLSRFLAIRTVPMPNPPVYLNPTFRLYCKMLHVGVPRGAVLQRLKKDGVANGIAKIVLDGDHYAPAPTAYAPPPIHEDAVILSRVRPDEHWRLVHRGLRVLRSGNAAGMDLLEFNGDYMVKLRRETEREKSARTEVESCL